MSLLLARCLLFQGMRPLAYIVLLPLTLLACSPDVAPRGSVGSPDGGLSGADGGTTPLPIPSSCVPDCASGQRCVDGLCITPSTTGAFCEFDPECGEQLCIGGRCTPDPRDQVACGTDNSCSNGLVCVAGQCICQRTADCPTGSTCSAGACIPGDGGCIGDDECAGGMVCDRGTCLPMSTCEVVHPDLSGTDWQVNSTLHMREALPDWLAGFLSAVERPFLFIGGRVDSLDLDLPLGLNSVVENAFRNWADQNLPRWVRDLLGAIGVFSDVIDTWTINETMRLSAGSQPDSYLGEHVWTRVCFDYLGSQRCGTPQEILGWQFTNEPFHARAVCGTLSIDRHDVNVSIAGIIRWIFNAIVEENTGYETIEAAFADVQNQFCSAVADVAANAAEGVAPGYGGLAGGAARSWCNDEVSELTSGLTNALAMAALDADVMDLKGFAPIVNRGRLEPGTWEGSLLTGDFPGSFVGSR